ncbi:ATP-binding cassette domain-containing protein [Anaerocolumna sedimenticola]|uniref:ATP-binding cassette domain-containing protein n=1 Tax=Anaerocolumna sedimenticola TaxID=2696063 RepID=A0A6P1TMJ8_9FIRM|nr:ABC transporter ATP-binding protein [Anaerocolumna sedimenticola]QHQ61693.1 ATP-binding cassette domain-containing protein [Anaerocolumna sedimenticola]
MVKKLAACIGDYKKYAILTPIVMVGEVMMEILIPFVMSKIIDIGILGNGGITYIIKMGILMITMALISLCFGAVGGKFAAIAGMGFAKNLRKRLFDKVQDFSFANVDKFSTPSLVTRLTTDVTNTQNAFMMLIRMAVRAPIMLIGATIMAIIMNAKLSIVFLIAIPFLGFALYIIMSKAHPRFVAMLKLYDRMNSDVQENLVGIRVVKAFVREAYEKTKFQNSANAVRKAQVRAEKLIILNGPVMQISMYGCILAVLWFGGNMVMKGSFEIGQISSFINYITQILMSLMMISMIFIMLVISRASMTRIVEVLDEEIDIKDNSTGLQNKVEDGSIEFNHVSFSYAKDKENLTLSDINFHINSGETIGIIGGTGSSKSTLVSLIPRLYDVLEGEIKVGGINVKDYALETLRNDVAMVLQKNVLFSGTIRENLKWGNEAATEVEIVSACKAAQAYDFIMSFPDGLETDLGQGGVNVSGGQKQRLCIARALLKKPKIIILDDSTSAVDTATDSKIRRAFKETLTDTTTIIIAQRISSVCDADRILVLDDGKIDAFASHEELMKNNKIYREVYESQQKGDE